MKQSYLIAVVGLGYVGLPLAIEFTKKYKMLGFDINKKRIQDLLKGNDETNEADLKALKEVTVSKSSDKGLYLSSDLTDLKKYTIFIITVPTPLTGLKRQT